MHLRIELLFNKYTKVENIFRARIYSLTGLEWCLGFRRGNYWIRPDSYRDSDHPM
jgi:hypothetical protein